MPAKEERAAEHAALPELVPRISTADAGKRKG
jgi:hypothetical protein